MRVVLVNASTDPQITRPVLAQIASALGRQQFEHFAPFWDAVGADVGIAESLDALDDTVAPVAIFDDADQPGVLGYHSAFAGHAFGRVFWGPIRAAGGTLTKGSTSLSVTLSHEVLELVADPYAAWWSDAPQGEVALEACDPVEGDAYEIDGVSVSNFVSPRWFRSGSGPYDWIRLLSAPFALRPGGYMIARDEGGNVHQVWGESYPAWRRATKGQMARAARRSSVRRAA